jgi:GTP-dependent phosphoenolpyruvate carboxykinase
MMHMIFIPRVAVLVENKLTVILLGGLFYSVFSLFDQGVDYSNLAVGLTSFTYVVMTQTMVGMGKATFTVVTGNPFIHFITLHIFSARVPFDTRMFVEIFKIK